MPRYKRPYLLILVLLLWEASTSVLAGELVVRHIRPEGNYDQRNDYYLALLTLSLEKTQAQDGGYKLLMRENRMLQARAILSVAKKQFIDVVWTMTSKDREETLLPIRIPLLKGLLGHRVFIIRKQDKDNFQQIQSLEQLKTLVAGQGHDWPDVAILEANGIKVAVGAHYDGLFSMLRAGRFDYFPRGLNEPWAEVQAHQGKGLMVEDRLLLRYPAPIYFFVHKNNGRLAQRIEKGLRLAIEDGSFDDTFYNHPANKGMLELTNIENRKVFTLENPLLSDKTPIADTRLWYVPGMTPQSKGPE